MHKIVKSTAYQVGGGRVGTPWDTVVKQAIGFPPEKSPLLAPPPRHTLAAAVTVRWHHGVMGPRSTAGLSLCLFSFLRLQVPQQVEFRPGKMAVKCTESPPSQAHSAFIHTSTHPHAPARLTHPTAVHFHTLSPHRHTLSCSHLRSSLLRSYALPFASSCGQPARCESLSSTSCPPSPLQAHSGCLLHSSYTRRIPRPGMLRSYLGVKKGEVRKTLFVVS